MKPATSLIKALDLITLMTAHPEGLKTTALVEAIGLPRSSVLRMLGTLEAYGLVEKAGREARLTERFHLWAARDRYGMQKSRYRPVLEDVLAATGEVVLLGVPEGASVVHIDCLEGDNRIRVAPLRETRHPLECTAMGKLVLADRQDLKPTRVNAALKRDIEEARRTGIGWNREEENEGVIVVATHGFERGPTEPMIAVAWPKFRFTEAKAEAAVKAIRAALKRHAGRPVPGKSGR